MEVKEKDKSLLELAVVVVSEKNSPQPIIQIAKEAMERKGLKSQQGRECLARFFADFMESGLFVYCGDGKWDIKERQPLSELEKDNSEYRVDTALEEEVRAAELKTEGYDDDEDDEKQEDEDDGDELDEIEAELSEEERLEEQRANEEYVEKDEIERVGGIKVKTGYEEDEGEDDEDSDSDDLDDEDDVSVGDLYD